MIPVFAALFMSATKAQAPKVERSSYAVQQLHDNQARMLADDRQKKMAQDPDQLLAMAPQLKSAVDNARKDELSVQVIRQADEIEKLAKAVKERMKQ